MTVLLPIIALLIGWGLNEIHHAGLRRRDFRSAICKALAYLLEVRFQLQALEFLIAELKHRVPEANMQMPQFRSLMETIIGNEDHIDRKYLTAVDAVAARDPFLAYELASRNRIGHFFRAWRQWASTAGAPPTDLENIEAELKKVIGPKFDEIIVSVARNISWRAKWRTRRILSRQFEIPEDLAQLFDSIHATSDDTVEPQD
ncbi:MAG: hypothetical protein K0U72_06555 [Gammaproteobacteria bacterium]|nr:hypothetical protein [Gammaproteobacteria bacterium]